MKLIRSNLDDPTRTSLLVGSSKLEAASIGRPLSFPTKRECRLLADSVISLRRNSLSAIGVTADIGRHGRRNAKKNLEPDQHVSVCAPSEQSHQSFV